MVKTYAAKRARLLFGCYRKGDANDPDTYVAAITAVLSRYPEEVIKAVTHPAKGLPIRTNFLPTVREVHEACEDAAAPRREAEARKKRIEQQLIERNGTPERPVYAKDSAEAKAVKVLHDIVGRTSAFFTIFRRSDGSVTYTKLITPQLAMMSAAPRAEAWVILTRQQAAAWEELLRTVFEPGLLRTVLREGSSAPWPWPPSVEGKLYPSGTGPPETLATEDDLQNFR